MALMLRLTAYAPGGEFLGELPSASDVSVSFTYPTGGAALNFAYSRRGVNADVLDGLVTVAVEVSTGDGVWSEPDNGRFVLIGEDSNEVSPEVAPRYSGVLLDWALSRIHWAALPKAPPVITYDDEGNPIVTESPAAEHVFATVTAGTILRKVLDDGAARGAGGLFGIDTATFTPTVDSAGHVWSQVISINYQPGTPASLALANLIQQGMLVHSWRGRQLRLYDGDGPSRDLVAAGVSLVVGRDIAEAPVKITRDELATVALVRGDDGIVIEVVDAGAVAKYGRLEVAVDAAGITDQGAMRALGEQALSKVSEQREEHTHGIAMGAALFLPMVDYLPGDMVISDVGTGERAFRVRQVTLTVPAIGGPCSGNVVLNDRIAELEERLARRVAGLESGSSASGGTGARPAPWTDAPEQDATVPNPPTGLTASSFIYHYQPAAVGGDVWGGVDFAWDAPVTNTDGTPCNDIASYEVAMTSMDDVAWRPGNEGAWRTIPATATPVTRQTYSPLTPGMSYTAKVRAIDGVQHTSEWSVPVSFLAVRDTEPPPVPSAPSLSSRLGVLTVTWDGMSSTGAGMPADFRAAIVHVRYSFEGDIVEVTAGEIWPGSKDLVITDLPYQTDIEVWLTTGDTSGNVSTAGASATMQISSAVGAEIDAAMTNIVNIGNAVMADGQTLAEKLASVGAGGTLDVGNLSASSLAVPEAVVTKLWSDVIRARKITADMLAIGVGTNMMPDPGFLDPTVTAARVAYATMGVEGAVGVDTFGRRALQWSGSPAAGPKRVYLSAQKFVDGVNPWDVPENCVPYVAGQYFYFRASVGTVANGGKVYPAALAVKSDGSYDIIIVGDWMSGGSLMYPSTLEGRVGVGSGVLPAGTVRWVPLLAVEDPVTDLTILEYTMVIQSMADASLIVDGAIQARHLTSGSVTAGKIAAGAVEADKIAAGAITAAKISANAIDGKTITGALIQSDAAANVGVKFDTYGISAYNGAYTKTVNIDRWGNFAATGTVTALANDGSGTAVILSGSVFGGQPGLRFQTNRSAQLHGTLVAKSSYSGYTAGSVVLHGAEDLTNLTGRSELELKPNGDWSLAALRGSNFEARITGSYNNIIVAGKLDLSAMHAVFSTGISGSAYMTAGSTFQVTFYYPWPEADGTARGHFSTCPVIASTGARITASLIYKGSGYATFEMGHAGGGSTTAVMHYIRVRSA